MEIAPCRPKQREASRVSSQEDGEVEAPFSRVKSLRILLATGENERSRRVSFLGPLTRTIEKMEGGEYSISIGSDFVFGADPFRLKGAPRGILVCGGNAEGNETARGLKKVKKNNSPRALEDPGPGS